MENKQLILIADDDAGDRYLVKLALEESGYDLAIREFENGADLIDYMERNCDDELPKFILLDLNMPKKTGMEVLDYMHEKSISCAPPVIVFSTSSDQRDITRSKELGAVDYIVKPPDYAGYVSIAKSLGKYLYVPHE